MKDSDFRSAAQEKKQYVDMEVPVCFLFPLYLHHEILCRLGGAVAKII
jgi:hypothetical protein